MSLMSCFKVDKFTFSPKVITSEHSFMCSEIDAFRLYHQNLYYGNAGDSLYSHNGMPFSTFDVDNDNRDGNFAESSCARLYKVGKFLI